MDFFYEITLYGADGRVVARWSTDRSVIASQGGISFGAYDEKLNQYLEVKIFGTIVVEQKPKTKLSVGDKHGQ